MRLTNSALFCVCCADDGTRGTGSAISTESGMWIAYEEGLEATQPHAELCNPVVRSIRALRPNSKSDNT